MNEVSQCCGKDRQPDVPEHCTGCMNQANWITEIEYANNLARDSAPLMT